MKRIPNKRLLVLAAVLLAIVAACATAPKEQAATDVTVQGHAPVTHLIGMHQPRPGLYTGGQPQSEDWTALAAKGVRTVISLRPEAELGTRDESAEVRAAGMTYRNMPIAGPAEITAKNASLLWAELEKTEGSTVVHCSSGNRVGALLAIGAATHGGMDTESAIAFGRSAGLGSAEARVREVLAETSAP